MHDRFERNRASNSERKDILVSRIAQLVFRGKSERKGKVKS